VYYRGTIELDALAPYGEVHPPGAWGRIMNGGAWFRLGDTEVDVILRDLDVAEHWTEQATQGVFELDALLGYLAGVPNHRRGVRDATDFDERAAGVDRRIGAAYSGLALFIKMRSLRDENK